MAQAVLKSCQDIYPLYKYGVARIYYETRINIDDSVQKEKIGDLLWQSKNEATETLSADAKEALEGFENELEKETNRITDDALQQVGGEGP